MSVKPVDIMAASGNNELNKVLVARAATVTAVVYPDDKRLASIKANAQKIAEKALPKLPTESQIDRELAAALKPIRAANKKAQAKLDNQLEKLKKKEKAIYKQMNTLANKTSVKERAAKKIASDKHDALWLVKRQVRITAAKLISKGLRDLPKGGS